MTREETAALYATPGLVHSWYASEGFDAEVELDPGEYEFCGPRADEAAIRGLRRRNGMFKLPERRVCHLKLPAGHTILRRA